MSQKTFEINSSRRQISLHEEQKRRYNQGNVGRGGDGEAYKREGGVGNHCCHLF
jgi:hypothetical protein